MGSAMHTSGENSSAFQTLKAYLAETNWAVEPVEGRLALQAHADTELCPLTYFFQIIEERDQFLFYISPDLMLPAELLPEAAEYVARANYGMRIGNFELDYVGGTISFKSSLNYKGDRLSRALIEGAILPAIAAFEEYFPGLAKVIAGIASPLEAFQETELAK